MAADPDEGRFDVLDGRPDGAESMLHREAYRAMSRTLFNSHEEQLRSAAGPDIVRERPGWYLCVVPAETVLALGERLADGFDEEFVSVLPDRAASKSSDQIKAEIILFRAGVAPHR